jgi:integrase
MGPDPMARVDPPKVTRKVKPILAEDDLAKLLKDAEGTDFVSRRDMAILRVLIDCGARVSGIGTILLADVSLPHKVIPYPAQGRRRAPGPAGQEGRRERASTPAGSPGSAGSRSKARPGAAAPTSSPATRSSRTRARSAPGPRAGGQAAGGPASTATCRTWRWPASASSAWRT